MVGTSRRGRDNQGSTPGVDICIRMAALAVGFIVRERVLFAATTRRPNHYAMMWFRYTAQSARTHMLFLVGLVSNYFF